MLRTVPMLLAALLLTGCAGESARESCVAHSVEEGVDPAAAEEACARVEP